MGQNKAVIGSEITYLVIVFPTNLYLGGDWFECSPKKSPKAFFGHLEKACARADRTKLVEIFLKNH